MQLQDLQDQLQLHWTNNFAKYYWCSVDNIYKYVWRVWRQSNKPKPDFPHSDLSLEERNALFYETIWRKKFSNWKLESKERQMEYCRKVVKEYNPPTGEKYTWRFAFAFYKF